MALQVKFQPWKVLIKGIATFVVVASDQAVDLSGVGGIYDFYDVNGNGIVYPAGSVVQVRNQATYLGVTPLVGTYVARQPVPAGGTNPNTIPQFPYPTGPVINIYWMLIAFGPQQVNVCNGQTSQIYINSSEVI